MNRIKLTPHAIRRIEAKGGYDRTVAGLFRWMDNHGLHRVDGPAVIQRDGMKEWWQHNKRHREDGPAIVGDFGRREWWLNGFRHRVGGPAVISGYGIIEWWQDGKRHRLDGPAMTSPQRDIWWIDNRQVCNEVRTWIEQNELDPNWRGWSNATWCLFRLRFE